MPFINVKTNARLSDEQKQEIENRLSSAISILPGKSYHYLMIAVEDNISMMFHRDTDINMAMVEVKIFGSSTRSAYQNLTAEICEIMYDVAQIDGKSCYVKYTEVEHWGYDGVMF
ncbi:MAG: phenylpyruvate tautomerase MIF-related protein [Ruminococcus sp.]|jgi:phenylpyruvate tautomerase PptA (4-oxalocrotonate tautomerase family)|nr:phenylpyruvate tautomerase MIF-related protein [Ruminococcus sp.]